MHTQNSKSVTVKTINLVNLAYYRLNSDIVFYAHVTEKNTDTIINQADLFIFFLFA